MNKTTSFSRRLKGYLGTEAQTANKKTIVRKKKKTRTHTA
jgi:hypothetical protein